MNNNIFLTLSYLVIFLASSAMSIFIHENVHKQISIYHGCKDPTIHYGWNSYFVCNEYYPGTTTEQHSAEEYLHGWNEIVGYTASMMIFLVISSAYLMSFAWMNK